LAKRLAWLGAFAKLAPPDFSTNVLISLKEAIAGQKPFRCDVKPRTIHHNLIFCTSHATFFQQNSRLNRLGRTRVPPGNSRCRLAKSSYKSALQFVRSKIVFTRQRGRNAPS
jgi:hypothetical protein